jgi:hypothetical protein
MIWLVHSTMSDLLPPHQGFPGVAQLGLKEFLLKLKQETTFLVWLGLVGGAVVYAITPILTVYIPLPSMFLPEKYRDLHADRICSSRFYLLRQTVFLLKMYACMCWGQAAEVRQQLNVMPYPEDPGTFRQSP